MWNSLTVSNNSPRNLVVSHHNLTYLCIIAKSHWFHSSTIHRLPTVALYMIMRMHNLWFFSASELVLRENTGTKEVILSVLLLLLLLPLPPLLHCYIASCRQQLKTSLFPSFITTSNEAIIHSIPSKHQYVTPPLSLCRYVDACGMSQQ